MKRYCKPHPGDRVAMLRGHRHHGTAVLDRRAQRLLDEDVLVARERIGEHGGVGEVGGGDHDRVDVRVGEQVDVIAVGRDPCLGVGAAGSGLDTPEPPLDARATGIGERHHHGAVDVVEIQDVLAAHHPAADDPVPDGVAHPIEPTPPSPPPRSVRDLFRNAAQLAH